MSSTLRPGRYVGKSIKRVNDPRLVTGHGSFVDDLQLPGMLYAKMVRSPYAHAEIGAIDGSDALKLPGVVAVVTGAELADFVRPQLSEELPPHRVLRRYPLAIERARFAGDPVAVVLAESPYAAEDGAELVQVDYDPLPVVTEIEAALAEGAPLLYPEWGENLAWTWEVGSGDVDGALARAAHVVEVRLINQRLYPAFIEPRAILVNYVPLTGELTAWATSQTPHRLRGALAGALGIPENLVRGIAPDVGGAFGAKGPVYPEYIATAALAHRLGRPVKWTETRTESFVGTTHGRDQIQKLRAAVDPDGVIEAVEVELLSNCGAYNAGTVAQRTGQMSVGPYFIQAVRTVVKGVMTNTSPTGAYRGAGRPEAAYMLERLVDAVARELKLDPAEVRRRNFTPPERFPYPAPTGIVYDSGDYTRTLDTALDRIGYAELRAEQARLRAEGRLIGLGIGFFCERAGPGWDSGSARITPSGAVVVSTGVSPHGQGEETTFAQIVADELGVPLEDVTIHASDTAVTPQGIGTFGSRGTSVGGSAVYLAVRQVKEKALRFAAAMLEAGEEDLDFVDGRFQVRGAPDRAVTLKQVARAAYGMGHIPGGLEPGLDATSYFMPNGLTFPFGAHLALVEVERETGAVKVLRYLAVDDCGPLINPMIVQGQVQGGLAQGFGQALFEGVVYDPDSGQLLTGTFMDYTVPHAEQLPDFETGHTVTPSPTNPLGVKGVGEAGTTGAPPALVNAVLDALAPLGVRRLDMPLTAQRVWQAMRAAAGE